MNGEPPSYVRPSMSVLTRSRSEGVDKFIFNADDAELGARGSNQTAGVRSRRASLGSAQGNGFADRPGGRAYSPVSPKVAHRPGSIDNESLREAFWDSVLVDIQQRHELTVREPGDLSPMRVRVRGMEFGEQDLEQQCDSDPQSCQTPEMLPENKHHEKLNELIAQCANLTCQDGPAQATDDSNNIMMPSSPSSSEASVTSRLKNKECWMEGRYDLEGALRGNCDPMTGLEFAGAPEVTAGTQ